MNSGAAVWSLFTQFITRFAICVFELASSASSRFRDGEFTRETPRELPRVSSYTTHQLRYEILSDRSRILWEEWIMLFNVAI